MRLLAISDLHLGREENRRGLERLPAHPEDWLALVGDVGEKPDHLVWALRRLVPRFARLLWTPGNHDLWVHPQAAAPRGEGRYRELVAICRDFGVLTPEDPYPVWPGSLARDGDPDREPPVVVPLFLLYDYTFRPDDVPAERALAWAAESGIVCADEAYLDPAPHPTRAAWCAARCAATERRLEREAAGRPTILLSHFPLRRRDAVTPRVPRFSIWCGTRRSDDWPERFDARAVVYGHLHIRQSRESRGVRYEEVSLGYPGQWREERGVAGYLREILPGTGPAAGAPARGARGSSVSPARDPRAS